jgi:predicted RNA binding protein YcfA (HicA-like mRNA interferase family)
VSPPLPRISGDDAIRALERAGFRQIRQRGSHLKLRSDDGRVAIVPRHRELATGTLRSVIRQAGMTIDEFVGFL